MSRKRERRRGGQHGEGKQPGPNDTPLARHKDDLPLYEEYRKACCSLTRAQLPNVGLVFDRLSYVALSKVHSQDADSRGRRKEVSDHHDFLETVKTFYAFDEDANPEDPRPKALQEVLSRQDKLLEALARYRKGAFSTQWRFVSGLGKSHCLETGFTWDRNLGVPYLPGSSVKGIARAWAQLQAATASDAEMTDKIARIFGPERTSQKPGSQSQGAVEDRAGTVIFFAAYPESWPVLEIDVMNPHYGEYYRDPSIPPGDWLSPNPIFFLTVAPGTRFRFAIALRPSAPTDAEKDLDAAWEWLREGLQWLGAGAKTAVGYGYFSSASK
ncbi:MAG: type III-B CRISPR module RAMP protein Cmr6 [Armatimonadetes bacterium]|nr:type III-B CRISPR module RAMP protein Cmr6 [Armatimonadota bacterium]